MTIDRIPLNSRKLQDKLEKEYKKFFVQHHIVTSVPHVLNRGHGISRGEEQIKIKQKTAARMFGGIAMGEVNTGVKIKTIGIFDAINERYKYHNAEQIISKIGKLEKGIQKILEKHNKEENIEINILSEYQRGQGFSFVSILCVVLASTIQLLIKTESTKEETRDQQGRCFDKKEEKELYSLAIELNTLIDEQAKGSSIFASIFGDKFPIIKVGGEERKSKKLPKNMMKIKDFFGIKDEEEEQLPFDYGIIHFGCQYDRNHIGGIYKSYKREYEKTNTYLEEQCTKQGFDNPHKTLYDPHTLNKISAYFTIKPLQHRENVLKDPHNQDNINKFIQTITEKGFYNALVESSFNPLIQMYSTFEQSKTFHEEKIGIMSISSGQEGGTFLFVTPYQKSRDTVETLYKKLQEQGYQRLRLEYLSRGDGIDKHNTLIHQNLDANQYSIHIPEDAAVFQDTKGKKYISTHRSIIEQKYKGILLDTIDNKIYINGKKLTHKELITQSATVDILNRLIQNIGVFINNNELPASSYSKNKSSMMGKVILPLQNITEKHFSEKIEMTCTGTLYSFDVRLDNNKIPIAIIKRHI